MRRLLESFIVAVRDRLTTGKSADRVCQNIEPSETRDNLIHMHFGGFVARNFRRHRRKPRAIEIRLLYSARCSDNSRAGIEKRLGYMHPKAPVRAGHKYNFALHGKTPISPAIRFRQSQRVTTLR